MPDSQEERTSQKVLNWKLNLYCIHKLLWDSKQSEQPDNEIWADIKELFQSVDYGLQMELRPIPMIWGDITEIEKILKGKVESLTDTNASREARPQ